MVLNHILQWLGQFASASALVKILLFFAIWVGLWLPIAIPLAIALKWKPLTPITSTQKLPLVASLYAIAPLVIWAIMSSWGESLQNYGLSITGSWVGSVVIGWIAGVLGLLAMFAIQFSFGWVRWQTGSNSTSSVSTWSSTLLTTLLLGLWVSITEETIFRGVMVNHLLQDFSLWGAAAIASLIFAVLHLVWEGWDNVPQLPGLWLMGMVLVLARWVDGGQLGLAVGLHAGWIWAIASIDTLQILKYTGNGSVYMTGLGEKPLAGGMGLSFLLVTGAVLWGVLA